MNIAVLLYVAALVLALIEQFRARGESLIAWAVVAVCVGLLWAQWA